MKKNYVINYVIISVILVFALSSCSKYKDDLEPNDSRSEATKIKLGTTYPASLSKKDVDFFKFTTANSGVWDIVEIKIENKGGFIVGIKIYSEQGVLGLSSHGDRDIDFTMNMYTSGGTFYISVFSMNDNETGDYTLTINNLDANDDNEPDDTFEDARVVDTYPTGLLSGNVLWNADNDYPDGDWEFFYVKVNSNKRLTFSLDPEKDDFEMQFQVYSEAHDLIDAGLNGLDGETLSYHIDNPTGAAVYIYIKVGGTLGTTTYDGSYFASFEEGDIP
jgi:hypothetical protein